MEIFVGEDTLGLTSSPSSYIEIDRTWNDGDRVIVFFKMEFAVEHMNNLNSWVALKKGPIVLAAKTSTNKSDMPGLIAGDARFGHSPSGALKDPNSAPRLKIDLGTLQSEFIPVNDKPMTYTAPGIFQNSANEDLVFEPFFRVHDARYMMYWNATLSGETSIELPQKNDRPFHGIRALSGALHFSFNSADASRHVVLYTLSGKRITDIAAPSQTITLNYRKQGIGMTKGMYAVQIVSDGKCVSQKVFITK
jgi:hypothetical protein